MSEAVPTLEENLAKAMLVPCESKDDLHSWIECYLGLDIPDCIVDPESTTSPMDLIWLIYDTFRRGEKVDWKELMAFSSRDSFKTLGASVLEVLVLMHLNLSIAHMAAIERQAKKSQQYVKGFFQRPYLRDYVTKQNESSIEVTRYFHKESELPLTPAAYAKLTPPEQAQYRREWNYIVIVVCTMQGANSEHVPFFVVDEVDVVPKQHVPAYREAKFIPSPWKGKDPITLYTSTRKFAFGLVQSELDSAHETGLKSLHWNIIDVTEACPPERHLPQEPKITIYRTDPDGKTKGHAISENEWKALPPEKQAIYTKDTGYAGCLKNCKLFFACKGNLATRQKSKSPLLKDIDYVTAMFRKVSPGLANAQLLCKKPSEEGLVYPSLSRERHMRTASQIAEMITGEPYPSTFTKADLIALMKDRNVGFYAGMDHGTTHNFAVVSGGKLGTRMFIFDVQSAAGLEVEQRIQLCNGTIKEWDPIVYPDMAQPDANKTFKRKGYRITEWKKTPGSVRAGIESVQTKLLPAVGDPELFFLEGDEGCELLFRRMSMYHWLLDEAGRPTEIPTETIGLGEDSGTDDECDACRYLVMNVFGFKGRVVAPKEDGLQAPPGPLPMPPQQNYLSHLIRRELGQAQEDDSPGEGTSKGRKGKFVWDI